MKNRFEIILSITMWVSFLFWTIGSIGIWFIFKSHGITAIWAVFWALIDAVTSFIGMEKFDWEFGE